MKKLIMLILLLMGERLFARENCNYFNCVINIDGDLIIPASISNKYLLVKDDKGKIIDTINFEYNIGTLELGDDDFKKLEILDYSKKIEFCFTYTRLANETLSYSYKTEIKPSWLNESYLIFNFYNYRNKQNWKIFRQREGYGVEVRTAAFKSKLPRL